tara:strand:+ start:404 stop:670 length:267 start_codon:yes stop_codon:yes gene_type:complete
MDNIHLHSNQSQKGILKEDINKEKDLEYRKSLPYFYDAMLPEIPSKEQLHPDIHKLITVKDIEALLELHTNNSWSCTAEKNYYWTFGG